MANYDFSNNPELIDKEIPYEGVSDIVFYHYNHSDVYYENMTKNKTGKTIGEITEGDNWLLVRVESLKGLYAYYDREETGWLYLIGCEIKCNKWVEYDRLVIRKDTTGGITKYELSKNDTKILLGEPVDICFRGMTGLPNNVICLKKSGEEVRDFFGGCVTICNDDGQIDSVFLFKKLYELKNLVYSIREEGLDFYTFGLHEINNPPKCSLIPKEAEETILGHIDARNRIVEDSEYFIKMKKTGNLRFSILDKAEGRYVLRNFSAVKDVFCLDKIMLVEFERIGLDKDLNISPMPFS